LKSIINPGVRRTSLYKLYGYVPPQGYGFWVWILETRTENGYYIFLSEIGSGVGELGGTPLPKIPRSTSFG